MLFNLPKLIYHLSLFICIYSNFNTRIIYSFYAKNSFIIFLYQYYRHQNRQQVYHYLYIDYDQQLLQISWEMSDDRIIFKVIMLGSQGVGKSSMLIRYIKGHFSDQYNVTVGVQFATKSIEVQENKQVKLQIWDTAGQQTFKAIVRTFYKGIAGVFLAFSIVNQQTLEGLNIWHSQVSEHGHEEIVFFLVGTKADLQDERRVGQEQIQAYMKQIGAVFYIETSAKYGTGIEQMFAKAAKIMYKKYRSNGSFRNLVRPVLASGLETDKAESFDLNRMSMEPEKKKCCR